VRRERELYRHHFIDPIHLDLRGLWIDDEMMPGFNLHQFKLMNISGSGMSVETDFQLPSQRKVHMQFSFQLEGEHLLKGKVVRQLTITDGVYCFGVEFNISVGDQAKLIRSINLLQLKKNQFLKEG
jgi:hypothetical protein